MRNVKLDNEEDIKGCISCFAGERNYYGSQIENLMNKNKGYYSNSLYHILNHFNS